MFSPVSFSQFCFSSASFAGVWSTVSAFSSLFNTMLQNFTSAYGHIHCTIYIKFLKHTLNTLYYFLQSCIDMNYKITKVKSIQWKTQIK